MSMTTPDVRMSSKAARAATSTRTRPRCLRGRPFVPGDAFDPSVVVASMKFDPDAAATAASRFRPTSWRRW
jgi:hypothetical protein